MAGVAALAAASPVPLLTLTAGTGHAATPGGADAVAPHAGAARGPSGPAVAVPMAAAPSVAPAPGDAAGATGAMVAALSVAGAAPAMAPVPGDASGAPGAMAAALSVVGAAPAMAPARGDAAGTPGATDAAPVGEGPFPGRAAAGGAPAAAGGGRGADGVAIPAMASAAPASGEGVRAWLCLTETRGQGREIARLPLGPGGDFSLSFIHSVSRTPVVDFYRVEGGEIVQTSEVFQAHGAGLPSIAGDIDATGWRHEDGRFILDMNRRTGPIPLRIQAQFENTLHVAGTDLPLAELGHGALTLAPCDEETPH
ncbi:DUF1850 domain-containing protein [Paroceanicella profunda]|nr:DUF1850 domain-containing protein [Paroceanicella profunda]